MVRHLTARHDPALQARIVRRRQMYYDDPHDNPFQKGSPDGGTERPPFVRAGSSLASFAEYMAVIQDDANFVALIDVANDRTLSLALPAGPEGDRVFDRKHGNKAHKLDLEACLAIPEDDGQRLVAFGSGSQPERERIVSVRWRGRDQLEVSVHDGSSFYAALRETHTFAGSALNLEGAVYLGDDRLRFFERGNGAPKDGLKPVDATCDLSWSALWAHLQAPDTPPPHPENIVQYKLGKIGGCKLTFSDAEAVAGVVLYSASAEASSGSSADGAIRGSVLGVIDAAGARYTSVTMETGDTFKEKIEGLSIGLGNPRRAHFVVDDDKNQPSELFEVELSGPWYPNDA